MEPRLRKLTPDDVAEATRAAEDRLRADLKKALAGAKTDQDRADVIVNHFVTLWRRRTARSRHSVGDRHPGLELMSALGLQAERIQIEISSVTWRLKPPLRREVAKRIRMHMGAEIAVLSERSPAPMVSGPSPTESGQAQPRELQPTLGAPAETEPAGPASIHPRSIYSPSAAAKVKHYIDESPFTLGEFAITVKTTPRTLERFLKTGLLRKSIFAEVARAMAATPQDLLQ